MGSIAVNVMVLAGNTQKNEGDSPELLARTIGKDALRPLSCEVMAAVRHPARAMALSRAPMQSTPRLVIDRHEKMPALQMG